MVYSLCYVSRAIEPFTRQQLVDLLLVCRVRNINLGVTGLLLYRDSNFLQLLEGDKDGVIDLYAKIVSDLRHRDVLTVSVSEGASRRFPNWSMAFHDLDVQPVTAPGFHNMLSTPVDTADLQRPGVADELLAVFASSSR